MTGKTALASLLLFVGCNRGQKIESVALLVTVSDLSNTPISDVAVSVDKKVSGLTDRSGVVTVPVTGTEGRPISVTARCPEGYRAGKGAETELTLRILHPLGDAEAPPLPIAANLVCSKVTQQFVLVVRTNQSKELPIVVGGRTAARTDADGVAQTVLTGPIGEEIEVVLDTDDYPTLSPRSPSRRLVIPDTPQILVFDQDFKELKKAKRKKRPGRLGPRRI